MELKEELLNLLTSINNDMDGILIQKDIPGYIDKIIDNAVIDYILDKDTMVAFIAYYANDYKNQKAFLSMLVVKKEIQGKSYGSQLLEKAFIKLKADGFKSFELEVARTNINAISFYKKYGFEIVRTMQSKLLMKKYI